MKLLRFLLRPVFFVMRLIGLVVKPGVYEISLTYVKYDCFLETEMAILFPLPCLSAPQFTSMYLFIDISLAYTPKTCTPV